MDMMPSDKMAEGDTGESNPMEEILSRLDSIESRLSSIEGEETGESEAPVEDAPPAKPGIKIMTKKPGDLRQSLGL